MTDVTEPDQAAGRDDTDGRHGPVAGGDAAGSAGSRSRGIRLLPWIALVVVVAIALGIGARSSGPRSTAARVDELSHGIKCPTCSGQSAAESDAPASIAIREEIARLVRDGRSDGEIRAHFVNRYGRDILLTPESTGLGAVVWALPVAAGVVAVAGLGFAFRRWRRQADERAGVDGDAPAGGSAAVDRANRRPPLWAAGVAVVAVGAGLAVAATAGERLPGQPSSGTAPDAGTVTGKLAEARQRVEAGQALEAIKLYDDVLAEDPEQVEALAYRGWLLHLAGLSDEAMPYLDRAVAADPSYPDAHFFRGFILLRVRNDAASAVTELQAFLANDPPPELVPPVTELLREAQAQARTGTTAPATSTTTTTAASSTTP